MLYTDASALSMRDLSVYHKIWEEPAEDWITLKAILLKGKESSEDEELKLEDAGARKLDLATQTLFSITTANYAKSNTIGAAQQEDAW